MTEDKIMRLELKVAELTCQLARSRAETEALRAELHGHIPFINETLSTTLEDYIEHETFGPILQQTNLPLLSRLHPKDRKKVSIGAMLYDDPDRFNVNKAQVLALSRWEHPVDPAAFFYILRRHFSDIAEGKPMYAESMMAMPDDVSEDVRNQLLSAHRAATLICYRGDPPKPDLTRFQFKCDESDMALVLFVSFDTVKSETTLKRQLKHIRSLGCITQQMPTICEEAGEEEFLDPKPTTGFGENAEPVDSSELSLNGLVLSDDKDDDETSADAPILPGDNITGSSRVGVGFLDREIFFEEQRDDVISRVSIDREIDPKEDLMVFLDDAILRLDTADRNVAKEVIVGAMETFPDGLEALSRTQKDLAKAHHIRKALQKALPQLSRKVAMDTACECISGE